MGYNCVVCVKQVPDTKNITGDAMTPEGTVNRGALPAIFNPEDLIALEQALKVRDEHGGTVTVLTMGVPRACEVLREAMFRGADRGVLVTDRRAAASDTLATSYILSCAVAKLDPDLVFCGRQAIDGDTAQTGPQMAEKLGMPVVTYLEELKGIEEGKITVLRNIGNGWQTVRCSLPAVITVNEGAGTCRPAAAKRIMKFKKAKAPAEVGDDSAALEKLQAKGLMIDQWDLDDIEADLQWCGMDGSPTKVNRVQSIVLAGGEYHEFPGTEEGVAELVGELINDHTIG